MNTMAFLARILYNPEVLHFFKISSSFKHWYKDLWFGKYTLAHCPPWNWDFAPNLEHQDDKVTRVSPDLAAHSSLHKKRVSKFPQSETMCINTGCYLI